MVVCVSLEWGRGVKSSIDYEIAMNIRWEGVIGYVCASMYACVLGMYLRCVRLNKITC